MRPDKSALDQKLLDVIQKRSVVKSVGMSDLVPSVPSIDDNNNQDNLRRAALAHDLVSAHAHTHPQSINPQSSQPPSQSGMSKIKLENFDHLRL